MLPPRITVFALGVNDPRASLVKKETATIAPHSAGYATSAADRALHDEVATLVAALPCDQRTALKMRLHHHLGYAEIAANLRCSPGEARATVYATLCSLRAHVGDRL